MSRDTRRHPRGGGSVTGQPEAPALAKRRCPHASAFSLSLSLLALPLSPTSLRSLLLPRLTGCLREERARTATLIKLACGHVAIVSSQIGFSALRLLNLAVGPVQLHTAHIIRRSLGTTQSTQPTSRRFSWRSRHNPCWQLLLSPSLPPVAPSLQRLARRRARIATCIKSSRRAEPPVVSPWPSLPWRSHRTLLPGGQCSSTLPTL